MQKARPITAAGRESTAVLITLLFAYGYFFGGSGFNQNATFALTRAIVEQGRLHIDDYASNTADVSFHAGRTYSNKAPGLAIAAVVPYAIFHAIRGVPRDTIELNLALYLCTVAVCGVSGALIGVLLAVAARRRGLSPAASIAIALLTGLGTPLFAYSTMLFAHVPAALLVLLAFLLLDGTLEKRAALAGASMGAATFVSYLCAPLTVVLFAYACTQRRRDGLLYILGGLPFAIALAAYHFAAFGSPFRTAIATTNPAFLDDSAWLGIFALPKLDALWGVTFSPFRGLFYISPLMLVAVAGLVLLARSKRVAASIIAVAIGVTFLVNAAFNGWHGGYSVGPRYVLQVVPLLALGLIEMHGRARMLTRVLAGVSLLFNFAVTAVDPQPPDALGDPIGRYSLPSLVTGRPLEDEKVPWLADFYTGHTSTNRVAADELLPFQKHRPGSRESEWASFNLGELLTGPGSAASVLPWLLVMSALTLSLRTRRLRAMHTTPDTQAARSRSA